MAEESRGNQNKTKYHTSALAMNDDERARLDRLRKRMRMPMNKVVHTATYWLETFLNAQREGKKLKLGDELVMLLIPLDGG